LYKKYGTEGRVMGQSLIKLMMEEFFFLAILSMENLCSIIRRENVPWIPSLLPKLMFKASPWIAATIHCMNCSKLLKMFISEPHISFMGTWLFPL